MRLSTSARRNLRYSPQQDFPFSRSFIFLTFQSPTGTKGIDFRINLLGTPCISAADSSPLFWSYLAGSNDKIHESISSRWRLLSYLESLAEVREGRRG